MELRQPSDEDYLQRLPELKSHAEHCDTRRKAGVTEMLPRRILEGDPKIRWTSSLVISVCCLQILLTS